MRYLILLIVLCGCAVEPEALNACDDDGDGHERAGWSMGVECIGSDCDDQSPDVNPDAAEVCNGIDDNCNGKTADHFADDDGEPWEGGVRYHRSESDRDGDGILDCDDVDP